MTNEQETELAGRPPRLQRALTFALALLCASLVACGHHSSQPRMAPGFVGRPPDSWPANSGLARDAGKATLVMFANPHCPCTRASLADLGEIIASRRDRVKAYVVFIIPRWVDADWLEGEDLQSARALKGVTVVFQRDTLDARTFDARVSGHVVLYDADGRLGFRGGITGLRGLAGDNVGQRRVLAVLDGRVPDGRETRTFGCALYDGITKVR